VTQSTGTAVIKMDQLPGGQRVDLPVTAASRRGGGRVALPPPPFEDIAARANAMSQTGGTMRP
jgi:hypothetical protein